jgi:16S rRNA (guanine527-N7)-methyltransferase
MSSRLVDVLGEARDLGFFGPGPVDDHIDHARAFVVCLEAAERCVDLGSGGGVPALVAAELLPHTSWVLVESRVRRAAFLRRAVEELGFDDRIVVHEGRAETVPADLRERADAVTARSFGPPPITAECAAGWLAVGGALVVSEPPGGAPERWPAAGLEQLGFAPPVIRVGPPSIAVLGKVAPTPVGYPRRPGPLAKHPLW